MYIYISYISINHICPSPYSISPLSKAILVTYHIFFGTLISICNHPNRTRMVLKRYHGKLKKAIKHLVFYRDFHSPSHHLWIFLWWGMMGGLGDFFSNFQDGNSCSHSFGDMHLKPFFGRSSGVKNVENHYFGGLNHQRG